MGAKRRDEGVLGAPAGVLGRMEDGVLGRAVDGVFGRADGVLGLAGVEGVGRVEAALDDGLGLAVAA